LYHVGINKGTDDSCFEQPKHVAFETS